MYLATGLLTFMKHKRGCPGRESFRHFAASESAQSQPSMCRQIFWQRWDHPNDRGYSRISWCLLFISHTESFLQTRLMQFVPLSVATDRCSHCTSPSYLCSGIQFQFLQTSCGVQGPSRGLQAAAESKDRGEPHLARRPWTEKCGRQDSKTAAAAGHRGPAGKSHSIFVKAYGQKNMLISTNQISGNIKIWSLARWVRAFVWKLYSASDCPCCFV